MKCEGNHQWGQWLPRYPSTLQQMWINELRSNIRGIDWSWVIDVNPMSKERRPAIEACNSQGTNWFLSLIPGWYVEVDRKRLVKEGPWCIHHHWHETDIGKWCKMVNQMSMDWHGKWKLVILQMDGLKWNFPWTWWGTITKLGALTWRVPKCNVTTIIALFN